MGRPAFTSFVVHKTRRKDRTHQLRIRRMEYLVRQEQSSILFLSPFCRACTCLGPALRR